MKMKITMASAKLTFGYMQKKAVSAAQFLGETAGIPLRSVCTAPIFYIY